jgi:hypothetical protein
MISYYAVKQIALLFFSVRTLREFSEGWPGVIRIVEDVEVSLGFLTGILNDDTVGQRFIHGAKTWQDSSGRESFTKEQAPPN